MKGLRFAVPFYIVGSAVKAKESQAFDEKAWLFFILACLHQPVPMIQSFHQNKLFNN